MLLVQGAANELARQNQASEADPLLARDAGAFCTLVISWLPLLSTGLPDFVAGKRRE